MTSPSASQPPHNPAEVGRRTGGERSLERELAALKERLVGEATAAIGMVESALEALWKLDREAAKEVRRRDDRIDSEEVAIEEQALRMMTLQQPYARDFRTLAFILKVNTDVERVADHATSIAKTIRKFPQDAEVSWPTAMREMAERVPIVCRALLNALISEDAEAAKVIVAGDETIDALNRRLFDETLDLMQFSPNHQALGLLVYRIGRELERIGDLMVSIAEDIVYLRTGTIIRHEKKRTRTQAADDGSTA